MITVFIRSIIVYVFLSLSMRILGKRQLGELEVSELITTILVSEIASMPISNQDIPISYAIIPLVTIMTIEITFSLLLSKFTKLKNILTYPPSALIFKGKVNQTELRNNRISPEELISELRLKNISDPSQVEYAILEQNGLLSVIPKIQYQAPTLEKMNLHDVESGIAHIIISQGVWNNYNINILNEDKSTIEKYLQKKGISVSDVFLLTIDDNGKKNLILKEK